MIDLKPCPFCGSEAIVPAVPIGITDDDAPVECTNMDCNASDVTFDKGAWNTRPIEDALRKEIVQLQADNSSLMEQMNQMALKPNQEIIEWHSYPGEKPERPVGTLIPNPVSQLSLLVEYQTIDGSKYVCTDEYYWLNEPGFGLEIDVTVLAWAYPPKGVTND